VRRQAGRLAAVVALACLPLARAAAEPGPAPEPVVVAGGPGDQAGAAVVAGRDGFLVAWEECDACERGADLAVRRLDAGGAPSGGAVSLAASPADERAPALAFNRDTGEYLAVWSLRYPGTADRFGVRAQRLSAAGLPIGEPAVVAELERTWPAPVVSAAGAWHGFDVAWVQPGPSPAGAPARGATVVAARRLSADGRPEPETWQLGDARHEALRPLAIRSTGSTGAVVGWFAYPLGQAADSPSLQLGRLGASGRPIGGPHTLSAEPTCLAALAEAAGSGLLLSVRRACSEPDDAPLTLARFNRLGQVVGESRAWPVDGPVAEVALAGIEAGQLLVTAGPDPSVALSAVPLDDAGAPLGPAERLGPGAGPAIAVAGRLAVVAATRLGEDRDVVAYRWLVPLTATATAAPLRPTARPTVAPRWHLWLPQLRVERWAWPPAAGRIPSVVSRVKVVETARPTRTGVAPAPIVAPARPARRQEQGVAP
jgi:hypothetical protein